MAFVLTAVTLILPLASWAGWKDVRACLGEHIEEAIVLNKQRKTAYMQLSQGRSQKVSEALLWMERKLTVAAPFADAWAAPFQAKGIPILCRDFISMSETPAFKAQNPEGPDSFHNYRRPDVNGIKARLLELYKSKSYQGMAEYADSQIQELDRVPRYNCMVKHMLESVRRMAALTPVYMQMAQELDMMSPELLSRTVLRSHVLLLEESANIDELAAPLQAEGLPIVCQDVPYIPWP